MDALDCFMYFVAKTALFLHWTVPPLAGGLLYSHEYMPVRELLGDSPPLLIVGQKNEVHLFRFAGLDRKWDNLFASAHLLTEPPSVDVFQGANLTLAKEAHSSGQGLITGAWRRLSVWRARQLVPFGATFVALEPAERDNGAGLKTVAIKVVVLKVDAARVLAFLLAVILFFTSAKLARTSAFYYSSGCALGVCASLVLLVFVLSKLVPKKPVAYTILIGGWSLALYLFSTIWHNAKHILLHHSHLLVGYTLVTGLISLAVCYRLGPPRNERSLNLVQWMLQIVALGAVLASVQIEEIAMGLCACMVVLNVLPKRSLVRMAVGWWRLKHPRPRRLLTQEEYERQGKTETEKALRQLRDYCQSPECSAWKTVNKLRSPLKFAQFIEGSPDVSESEVESHGRFSESEYADRDQIGNGSVAAHRHSSRQFKRAVDPTVSDDSDYDYDDEVFRRRFAREADYESSDGESDFRLNYVQSQQRRRGYADERALSTGKKPNRVRRITHDRSHNGSVSTVANYDYDYDRVPATENVLKSRKSVLSDDKKAMLKRYPGASDRLHQLGGRSRERSDD